MLGINGKGKIGLISSIEGPLEGFILLIRFKFVHILEAKEWRKILLF